MLLEGHRRPSLLFAKDKFERWPHNKKHVIGGAYSGTRGELLALLGAPQIRFEHLGFFVRENVTVLKYSHNYSIWDCDDVYPHRQKCGYNRIPFTRRSTLYSSFRNYVLSQFVLHQQHVLTNVTIVDRHENLRKFPHWYLKKITQELASHHPIVVFFELMPFREQVRVVQMSRIMIMRHGAGEANLLFGRQNSLHIEVNSNEEMADRRFVIYNSISRLANCKHISVRLRSSLLSEIGPLERFFIERPLSG